MRPNPTQDLRVSQSEHQLKVPPQQISYDNIRTFGREQGIFVEERKESKIFKTSSLPKSLMTEQHCLPSVLYFS